MSENSSSKKRILRFFYVAVFFSMAASFAHPVTPTLIIERQLDSSMFGIALAAMSTMSFLFAPFWGKLCNYLPTRTIVLICGIGYAVGQYIFGSAYTEAQIIAGRMFAGMFTGGAFTALTNYLVNTSDPKDRGSNLTVYVTIQNVAGAVGYFVGGFMGLVSVNFTFGCQIVILAGSGILFYFTMIDDSSYKVKPDHKLNFKEVNPFRAFLDAKYFMTPAFAVLFGIIVICAIGQNSFEQVFNYYIKDVFGMTSVYNGTFKAAIAICGMIANSTLCLYLMKHTDTNKTFLYVVGGCCVPLGLALLFFESTIPFAVCDVAFFTLNTVRLPLMQNLCADRSSKENNNTVMGFYQSMNSLGSIFGAAFAGIIYNTNKHYPFYLAFGAFVIGLALSFIYRSMYSKSEKK
ncbi:MAG: MFS transporter [Firmicutes bacterium]|nr:MFS transporter [Bacillota bacterium]